MAKSGRFEIFLADARGRDVKRFCNQKGVGCNRENRQIALRIPQLRSLGHVNSGVIYGMREVYNGCRDMGVGRLVPFSAADLYATTTDNSIGALQTGAIYCKCNLAILCILFKVKSHMREQMSCTHKCRRRTNVRTHKCPSMIAAAIGKPRVNNVLCLIIFP